ncbi:hypothetical protein [Microbacterium oleivorans]|uniref:Uncharacterized protein n=1 Tax=Microbacterium oleivorans TaxID=273677 RepID=A0A7D5EWJ5_9MICO|nr:hypothetical protein [Microbacterium oleivorans]QLD11444.1 hypothetical protein HW566_06445 [Microbacterium oleivorans]
MTSTWARDGVDHHRIGPWEFEVRDDEFADIRWGGRCVLRSVRAVIRDRDWNTTALAVDRAVCTETSLTLHVRSREDGAHWGGSVRAEARAGSLLVLCDLETARQVDTNRTGLVALIPPNAAGRRLTVGHGDGSTSDAILPAAISPHQPVADISTLRWRDDGAAIGLAFDGDVFEMEDQRNWTDASFKVYSRPLSLPFPYRLEAGERVMQAITITADALAPASATADDARIELQPCGPLPAIGLGTSTAPDPAPPTIAAPRDAAVATTLVELDLAWPGWPRALARAASAGAPLDVRIVLPAEAPPAGSPLPDVPDAASGAVLADVVAALAPHRVARITAFQPAGPARHISDAAALALLRRALADGGIDVPVVGGSRAHFTELNRERHRLPPGLAGIVFSITPLFHSRDTEQLVESLAMQRLVARQAVDIAGGVPVHVGPITLRPHVNDVATTPPPRPTASDLAGGYGTHLIDADDPRQGARELAAWTIASAAALAVPGVASLTYFERWGPRGIVTARGDALPVAAAIDAITALSGREALSGGTADGLVWALSTETAAGRCVLAANLDRRDRRVELRISGRRTTLDLSAGAWRRVDLDEER